MNNRVIVTGGLGFIGVNLVLLGLNDTNLDFVVIDDLSSAAITRPEAEILFAEELASNRLRIFTVDYLEFAMTDGFRSGDSLIHLAANSGVAYSSANPIGAFEQNVSKAIKLFDLATRGGVGAILYSSSGASVAGSPLPHTIDSKLNPMNLYGAGKAACELYLKAYSQESGIPCCSLRFSNVYGLYSKNKTSVIAEIVKAFCGGSVFNLHGTGDQRRDFIFAGDLAEGILSVLFRLRRDDSYRYEVCPISTGVSISVKELVDTSRSIAESMGIAPANVLRVEERPGDVHESKMDCASTTKFSGWNPKTSLADGLIATFYYFLKDYE